jgi:hypothetical protein
MMAQPPLHLMSISVSLLESCGLFGMDGGTTFLEIINYMHHNTSMHRAALIMLKIFGLWAYQVLEALIHCRVWGSVFLSIFVGLSQSMSFMLYGVDFGSV